MQTFQWAKLNKKRDNRSLFGFSLGRASWRCEATSGRVGASRRYHAERGRWPRDAMVQCAIFPMWREGVNARTHVRVRAHASFAGACTVRQVIRVRGHESIREPWSTDCVLAMRERDREGEGRGERGRRVKVEIKRMCVCITEFVSLKNICKTEILRPSKPRIN